MTWAEAEEKFPECSAKWDLVCVTLPADFAIYHLFENAAGGLTIMGQSYCMIGNTWFNYLPNRLTWKRF